MKKLHIYFDIFQSHMLQHGEKKWKCGQCPAAFYRKQYLDVHMTNHTGEYPYVCELCGMKFK
jgi:KRAB domain-containing zinc finger protein